MKVSQHEFETASLKITSLEKDRDYHSVKIEDLFKQMSKV